MTKWLTSYIKWRLNKMEMRKYCSNCVIKCAKDGLFVNVVFVEVLKNEI